MYASSSVSGGSTSPNAVTWWIWQKEIKNMQQWRDIRRVWTGSSGRRSFEPGTFSSHTEKFQKYYTIFYNLVFPQITSTDTYPLSMKPGKFETLALCLYVCIRAVSPVKFHSCAVLINLEFSLLDEHRGAHNRCCGASFFPLQSRAMYP